MTTIDQKDWVKIVYWLNPKFNRREDILCQSHSFQRSPNFRLFL